MMIPIEDIVGRMTLEEKASLFSGASFWYTKGIERLDIPSVMMTDGPHGLRKQNESSDNLGINDSIPAICFPSAAGLASSWNRSLLQDVGSALGEECQAEDIAVLLGPGANIKRSPLCGRNFEYFSEDPFLSSEMAASHIKGVQSQGVGTSLKHFAVNNQEERRMSVDAVVDERTLRELYLASFEGAVKQAEPWTVMCSYNKVNGTYASENPYLLEDILREEWGFSGFVVSDWGAVNERVQGLEAGLELEMPSSFGAGEAKIIQAVKEGRLSESVLDRSAERLLGIIFKSQQERQAITSYDTKAHHEVARKAARESMVLLKNQDDVLPLKTEESVAVIGEFAKKPRFQGGGSSHVNPIQLDQAYEAMLDKLADASHLAYAPGYDLSGDDVNQKLIDEAKEVAAHADKAVIFAGLPDHFESEGYDRRHLHMPESHEQLICAISEVQEDVIVVLQNGAPIVMPWLSRSKAVLESYLGGEASGSAVADLLFGDANPSGKLAESFPTDVRLNPSYLNFPGEKDAVHYHEGLFVGYRYYDAKGIQPLFPFGHGLSYTSFAYRDLEISREAMDENEQVEVSVTVKNIGHHAGSDIVQLYVSADDAPVIRPDQELKGFDKVYLQPNEEQTVWFTLDKRAFAYYEATLSDWHVHTDDYHILIGASSRDIREKSQVRVNSLVQLPVVYHRNTVLGDLWQDPQAAPVLEQLDAMFKDFLDEVNDLDNGDMSEEMIKNVPLRGLVSLSGGRFTEDMLDDMLQQLNSNNPS